MKPFTCNCISSIWPADTLCNIIDNAKEISKNTFFKNCFIEDELKKDMKIFPNDYEYYKNKNIYFFTHSRVENFYL